MLALREWEVKKKHGTDIHTYGTDRYTYGTDRHTYGTDRHTCGTDRHTHGTDRHTCPMKNSFYARNFFVCGPIPDLGFFQTPRTHGESVHVLRFKIGPETEPGGPF